MGYKKIPNLYRPEASREIFALEEVYALEKIHGTSAHISASVDGSITLFPGGTKLEQFQKMINERYNLISLMAKFSTLFNVLRNIGHKAENITIYGEAYGPIQKMEKVYGPFNFVAFEVKVDEEWLTVPRAEEFVKFFGIPFVPYHKGPAKIDWLNEQRDRPSELAAINGMGDDKPREGIVIRSLEDSKDQFGNRIIAKHKGDKFKETRTTREVNPEKLQIWADARETAKEWVTEMRLQHVLDKFEHEVSIENTGKVIAAMTDDIREESGVNSGVNPEIEWSGAVAKEIGKMTAIMFKKLLNERLS